MMVEQSNVFANSTIYLIEKRDNLGLIMPWRVQTEDCDELINEYLKRGNFDTTNKELRRMMKEYMMRSKYSFVNTGHSGLGMDGYVRISSAARRAMDALAIYVLSTNESGFISKLASSPSLVRINAPVVS